MFTGLVQALGRVVSVEPWKDSKGLTLTLDPGTWPYRPSLGDSIAVDGCCLTLAKPAAGSKARRWVFQAVRETLDKTTLASLVPGNLVNLEHAARADTLLGGHIVQGHVDGVGRVARIQTGSDWRVWIELPRSTANLDQYLAPKGSICVSGVSLTVADLWSKGRSKGFAVALIPTTLEKTNLAALKPGDPVNLEMDVMAKTIVRWLNVYAARGQGPRPRSKASRRSTSRR